MSGYQQLGSSIASFFRPVDTRAAAADQAKIELDRRQREANLGESLADQRIKESQADALSPENLKLALIQMGVPENQVPAMAQIVLGKLGSDFSAAMQGTGRMQEQGFRNEAAEQATAGNYAGANAQLMGVASGPQALGAILGQGYVTPNRFEEATGENLEQTGLGAALVNRTNAGARASDARTNLVARTDPNRPRSTGAGGAAPFKVPSGYMLNETGDGLTAIPGGPRDKPAASDAVVRRNEAASAAAQATIDTIDRLTASPGYKNLGSIAGDIYSNIPFVRTDEKDAQQQLDTLSGQIALSTMSALKTLSAQGATGFGALNREELKLLQNSVASLQAGSLSNEQLAKNIAVVREKMQKIYDAANAAAMLDPAGIDEDDALVNKYLGD